MQGYTIKQINNIHICYSPWLFHLRRNHRRGDYGVAHLCPLDYGRRRLAPQHSSGHLVAVQFLGIPVSVDGQSRTQLAGGVDPPPIRRHPGPSGLPPVLDSNCAECPYLPPCHLYDKTGKHGSPGSLLRHVPSYRFLGSRQKRSGTERTDPVKLIGSSWTPI